MSDIHSNPPVVNLIAEITHALSARRDSIIVEQTLSCLALVLLRMLNAEHVEHAEHAPARRRVLSVHGQGCLELTRVRTRAYGWHFFPG